MDKYLDEEGFIDQIVQRENKYGARVVLLALLRGVTNTPRGEGTREEAYFTELLREVDENL